MKLLNQKQVNKKYKGKYIDIIKRYNYSKQEWEYEVLKSYSTIRENTTLGEDVGTNLEYMR